MNDEKSYSIHIFCNESNKKYHYALIDDENVTKLHQGLIPDDKLSASDIIKYAFKMSLKYTDIKGDFYINLNNSWLLTDNVRVTDIRLKYSSCIRRYLLEWMNADDGEKNIERWTMRPWCPCFTHDDDSDLYKVLCIVLKATLSDADSPINQCVNIRIDNSELRELDL